MNSLTLADGAVLVTLNEVDIAIATWEAWLKEEYTVDTMRTYITSMRKFRSWLQSQSLDLQNVNRSAVRSWRAYLKLDQSDATIRIRLNGVSSFYEWARLERDLPIANPTEGLLPTMRGKSKDHKRDTLTNRQVRDLLATCDHNTKANARDGAILHLLAYCALRTVEVHRLNVSNLRSKGGRRVLWIQGKGAAEADAFVVLSDPVEASLNRWLAVRGSSEGPLFTALGNRAGGKRLSLRSIQEFVRGRMRLAGVHSKTVTAHSLRHTAITSAILHGASIQHVQAMARHSSIETTMRYYHQVARMDSPAEDFVDFSNGETNA